MLQALRASLTAKLDFKPMSAAPWMLGELQQQELQLLLLVLSPAQLQMSLKEGN